MQNAIELRHITKTFGRVTANHDVSLDVRQGEILSLLGTARTYQTALAEYDGAHDPRELEGLLDKRRKLAVPVVLVTHDPDISCREIGEFGGASEEEARKIEGLWQDIMRAYLTCADRGEVVRAAHSSHCIHLTDPELVCGLV